MKFQDLIAIVAEEPVFETGLLLAGPGDPAHVRRQLSRWVRAGRVQQLRRGLYALAPPWRKRIPHPFLVANRLAPDSCVNGLSALAFAHAIPEYVAEVCVELTRFRGHLTLWGGGIHYAEIETAVPAGLPAPDGRAGSHRTDCGRAGS